MTMTSVARAMAGDKFWFAGGLALLGLVIHMMTGAMFGLVLGLVALRANPARGAGDHKVDVRSAMLAR